ncbi:hypothetical protein PHLH5_26390 [Pseudomonas sp. Cab53]|uniref:Uncharacterized protein n=2 Tax=Pseudomonas TaxID=286 RepID=A0A423GAF1_9PSED|nr:MULTISPECIES: hypothetical protein [Pseudomonas]KIQ60658.1 hypothetical protein RL74_04330 [Pseudomonas fluorescens]ROM83312.1 hypothetical protein BK652_13280 [Pseudomonas brassicacearum]BBP65098.1 hypothetical protein PHLH5_26390 [Pseudomonas sp. Cab53]
MVDLTQAEMDAVRARYEGACHEREIHRKKTLEHLSKQDALAVAEFKRRQTGLRASKTDLWSKLTKHRNGFKSGITGPLIRKALRSFLEQEQNGLCCYCQRPLVNIAYAKPIEHILPRATFVQYTFHFWNLAIACFDCNQIKLDNVWAGTDKHGLQAYPAPATFTEMYHPRFHRFAEHVRFIRVQTNDHIISIYRGVSEQGRHLCLNLLKDLSAREIVLNSKPELKDALEVINAHVASNEGNLASELETFRQALAKSTSLLIKNGGAAS